MQKRFALLFTLLLNISLLSLGQTCDLGYYYDGQGCLACDPLCVSCISHSICTGCTAQSFLVIRNDRLICHKCSEVIQGCAKCSSESSCSQCQHGYFISQQKCILSPGNSNMKTNTVVQCQIYQIVIDNTCVTPHPNCQLYNADASCKTCKTGSQMINHFCIPTSLVSEQATQTSQKGNQIKSTLICKQRQYVEDGKCMPIGKACLNFLQTGYCLQCDSGFILFQGLCVESPKEKITSSKRPLVYVAPNKNQKNSPQNIQNLYINQKTVNNVHSGITTIKSVNLSSKPVDSKPTSSNNHDKSSNFVVNDLMSKPEQPTAEKTETSDNPIPNSSIVAAIESKMIICDSSCATCTEDPSYCLTCAQGYASVDQGSYAGKCFQF